jgi:hypothetical protein
LSIFNAPDVRYLSVGGYAVMIPTEPRYTKDLDIWIDWAATNAQALFQAVVRFGAPLNDLQPADFTEPQVFYQIGMEPVRIYAGGQICFFPAEPGSKAAHPRPTASRKS